MHIAYAASECVPFAKTGGLADVVGALPREFARQGHQVTVYLPYYRQVQKHMTERRIAIPSITIPFHGYNRFVTVLDGGVRNGVQFYFFDVPELFVFDSGEMREVEAEMIGRDQRSSLLHVLA